MTNDRAHYADLLGPFACAASSVYSFSYRHLLLDSPVNPLDRGSTVLGRFQILQVNPTSHFSFLKQAFLERHWPDGFLTLVRRIIASFFLLVAVLSDKYKKLFLLHS